MTLPLFPRTLVIAALGAVALAVTTQVRAEGGEGSSIVIPQEADAAAPTSAESEIIAAPAGEDDEADQSKKTARVGKKEAARNNSKVTSLPGGREAGADESEPTSQSASVKAGKDEASAAEEASGPALVPAGKGRSARQTDAIRASALKPLIARYASELDLPFSLADAVVRLESRYNAKARNGVNLGLTQVNFRTAQSLGYKGDAAGLLDAETNLRYGLKYLAMAYKLAEGDTCGTILRYQFGLRTQTMTGASRVYCGKVKTIIATAE